jgi:hypothetical protein
MSQPRRKATYDDLLKVPEHQVAAMIDRELIASPRPRSRHALVTVDLVRWWGEG